MFSKPAPTIAIIAAATMSVACSPVMAQVDSRVGVLAQTGPQQAGPTFADLADLSQTAELVIRAEIRKQTTLAPERAPGLAPGFARLYIEARTSGLIAGSVPVGEEIRYLVDVPLTVRGKAPKLRKAQVILFGLPVPGRSGELQLVGKGGQQIWSQGLEDRLRPILAEMVARDAPPVVTGVRDALSVEGNLDGESETQLFLDTQGDGPVSVTIVRRPGMAPNWGVSWTEIVDQSARAPARDTLEWYRLACFLPAQLPGAANLSRDPQSRARADADYDFVMRELGSCPRTLG